MGLILVEVPRAILILREIINIAPKMSLISDFISEKVEITPKMSLIFKTSFL